MSQFYVSGSGGSGGNSITTILGDSGSITGPTVTIFSAQSVNNSGSSVSFVNAGTISTLNLTDTLLNTFLGNLCGNLAVSGSNNFGGGQGCLGAITTGSSNTSAGLGSLNTLEVGSGNCAFGQMALAAYDGDNTVAIGLQALLSLTSAGSGNSACGFASLTSLVSGSNNSAFGTASGSAITGNDNTAIGFQSIENSLGDRNTAVGVSSYGGTATTGSYNLALGFEAGLALTTSDSSNILLSNSGTPGDNNTIRIGTQGSAAGQHNKAFIAGVAGVTVANSQIVTVDTNGQLGSVANSNFQTNITSPTIDFKTVGATPIFTSTGNFLITGLIFYSTSISGVASGANVNFGWTSPTFIDWGSGFSNSNTATGQYIDIFSTNSNFPVIPTGQTFTANITGPETTATTSTGIVIVQGMYV